MPPQREYRLKDSGRTALANRLCKRAQNPDHLLTIDRLRKIILHSMGSYPAHDLRTVIRRDIRNQRARLPLRLVKHPSADRLLDRVVVDNHDLNSRLLEMATRLARLRISLRTS